MGQSKFRTLILEEKQNVLRIVLNRPDQMNALNAEMVTKLHSVLDRVDRVIDAILDGHAAGLLKLGQ